MNTLNVPVLSAVGVELDRSPACFGQLRDSHDIATDVNALRERMNEDGYLYLPGYLDRGQVLTARRSITDKLADRGLLHPDFSPEEAVPLPGERSGMLADVAKDSGPLQQVLYSGRMIEFYEQFLGGPVRHFDYTWLRAVAPGPSSKPHCDIVFMGRGTTQLFTAWTALGDIPIDMGGLMILENSHKHEKLRAAYGRKDVDKFCTNRRAPDYQKMGGGGNIPLGGALSLNPFTLRERLGGRWLTADFRAGDLLTFSMYTVHTGLDNRSDRLRISCDSRYQLASEPIDERWIGENPIGHGPNAKRGMIC
jgi:hypothetical protein